MNKDTIFSANAKIPTKWGDLDMYAVRDEDKDGGWMPDLALAHPMMTNATPVTVRIHSECITGDLFHSKRCDCGQQLDRAMEVISEDQGLLIYLRQEGRGIGIINKLKAYQLQDKGFDTVEANEQLGLAIDARTYEVAINILHHFGIKQIKLLTNNPEKINAFDQSGIEVVERLPIEIKAIKENHGYLKTKKDQMGHFLKMS